MTLLIGYTVWGLVSLPSHTEPALASHSIYSPLLPQATRKYFQKLFLSPILEFHLHLHLHSHHLQPAHHGASCSVARGAAAPPCKYSELLRKVRPLMLPRSSASMQRLSPTSPPQTSLAIGPESHMDGHLNNLREYVLKLTPTQKDPFSRFTTTGLRSRIPSQ